MSETNGGTSDHVLERILDSTGDPRRKLLIRGATVLTMDPRTAELPRGDVLIEGTKIAAVGPDLAPGANDGQALVIDAEGTIAIPGMQDTHRHSWQGALRRLFPDITIAEYLDTMHVQIAPVYRPEDMYIGTLVTALGALNSGVTTVLDFSHNSRTPAHVDACIEAWEDSGIRAVFACCGPQVDVGEWDHAWPANLRRLRGEKFASDDGLLTLRMGVIARLVPEIQQAVTFNADNLRLARELDIATSVDGFLTSIASDTLAALHAEDLLGDDITYIHCGDLDDRTWELIADSGGTISLAPTSDAQIGIGGAITPVQQALDHGVRPSLSVDVECSLTTDMFTQMQVVLNIQRMLAANRAFAGDEDGPAPLAVREVLDFATVEGARANGVLDRSGTISPGKEADIVLIRADSVGNLPLNNAVGTVVLGAGAADVDTVMVAGTPRKWRGSLLADEIASLRRRAEQSRDHVLESTGRELALLD